MCNLSFFFPSLCYVPYQQSGWVWSYLMAKQHFDFVFCPFGFEQTLTHPNMASSCLRHMCALSHPCMCVCLKGVECQVNMNPGRISIPFVTPINNRERCSIGKWQTGFSCLSWSGLEAHGWMNKERQSSCFYSLSQCHSFCLFTITTNGL